MKLKQILAIGTLSLLTGAVFAAAQPTPAGAVECAILPDSICGAAEEGDLGNSGIWRLLIWIINILTVGVGVIAVAAIVFAGFLYATARDDQAQTKKAIEMIRNTMIGIVAYIFMFAILQYLIPGGVFGNPGSTGGSNSAPPPGQGGPMRPT